MVVVMRGMGIELHSAIQVATLQVIKGDGVESLAGCDVQVVIPVHAKHYITSIDINRTQAWPVLNLPLFYDFSQVFVATKLVHLTCFVSRKDVDDIVSAIFLIIRVEQENDRVVLAWGIPCARLLRQRTIVEQDTVAPNLEAELTAIDLFQLRIYDSAENGTKSQVLVIVCAVDDLFELAQRCIVNHRLEEVVRARVFVEVVLLEVLADLCRFLFLVQVFVDIHGLLSSLLARFLQSLSQGGLNFATFILILLAWCLFLFLEALLNAFLDTRSDVFIVDFTGRLWLRKDQLRRFLP